MGIVTEDFSKNGKNKVESSGWVPQEFEKLFVEGSIEDDFLANMSFVVTPITPPKELTEGEELPPIGSTHIEREWKLGDFYPLLKWGEREGHKQQFPEQQIEDDIEKYSLKVTRDSLLPDKDNSDIDQDFTGVIE